MSDLRRKDAIKELCELRSHVAQKMFRFPEIPVDCFCEDSPTSDPSLWNWDTDPRIFEFIRDAVNEKIAREIATVASLY